MCSMCQLYDRFGARYTITFVHIMEPSLWKLVVYVDLAAHAPITTTCTQAEVDTALDYTYYS